MTDMAKSIERPHRSGCPIATTLDLVGDRWSLVIVRDMLTGKRRYGEFLASPEGITTNILADRLKRMEETGLIARTPYQRRPVRHDYALTEKGETLRPVLQEMCMWANRHFRDTWTPPASFMERRA
jgi:DNA-binding HxlR family transcriptional regulator